MTFRTFVASLLVLRCSCFRFHLIAYATRSHTRFAQRLVDSAKVGGFHTTRLYAPDDIDEAFARRNHAITILRPGSGYWLFKPYILMHHMMYDAAENDTVCYMDSKYEFVDMFTDTIDLWMAASPHIALTMNKPYESTYMEGAFSKQDAFVIMDADARWRNTPQAWCGFICLKRDFGGLRYASEWLTYMQDRRAVVDGPSVFGPENAEFRENRHDQTVCSILAKKWGVYIHAFPEGPVYNHYIHGT